MLDLKEKILDAYEVTAQARGELITKAVKEYFMALGSGGSQSSADLNVARTRLHSFLKKELLRADLISAISGGAVSDDRSAAAVALNSSFFKKDRSLVWATSRSVFEGQLPEPKAAKYSFAAFVISSLRVSAVTAYASRIFSLRSSIKLVVGIWSLVNSR